MAPIGRYLGTAELFTQQRSRERSSGMGTNYAFLDGGLPAAGGWQESGRDEWLASSLHSDFPHSNGGGISRVAVISLWPPNGQRCQFLF